MMENPAAYIFEENYLQNAKTKDECQNYQRLPSPLHNKYLLESQQLK